MAHLFEEHHADGGPYLLRELMRTFPVLVQSLAREAGLPPALLALVRQLALASDAPVGVLELARRLGNDPAAVSRQVKQLVERGLARKLSAPADKRLEPVVLTAKGRKLATEAHGRGHALEARLTAALGTTQVKQAALALTSLRELLEAAPLSEPGRPGPQAGK
jgi:DNA-binding MarR family transcriptional regulator